MDTTVSNSPNQGPAQKKKTPIIPIVIVAAIIIAVVAYFMMNKSTKEKYFLAEKQSMDQLGDYFKDRYEPELTWVKSTMEKPTEMDYTVGAQLTDPFGFIGSDVTDIVNSSQLKLYTATDYDEMVSTATVDVNVGPFEVSGFDFGLTADELSMKIPFIDDTWVIEEKDLPEFLNNLDPTFNLEEGEISFSDFFKQSQGLDEKDQEYIQKEYINFVYDMIPDDAFADKKEEIKVDGNAFKTEAIKMHLPEKLIIQIIEDVTDKAQKDDRLIEMISEELALSQLSTGVSTPGFSGNIQEEFAEQFREAMEIINENAKNIEMPEGITSTIWTHKGNIVKRDLEFSFSDGYEEATLNIVGEQIIEKDRLFMDYDIIAEDDYDTYEITFDVDSTWKDNEADDALAINFLDEFKISYEGNETLNKNKRDFDRTFYFGDSYDDEMMKFTWSGNAQFDKDKMRSENDLDIYASDFGGELLSLDITKDGKHVKAVEKPDTENVVNIGKMNLFELIEYIEDEVEPELEKNFGF